jgi:hypothetical protein
MLCFVKITALHPFIEVEFDDIGVNGPDGETSARMMLLIPALDPKLFKYLHPSRHN